MFDLAAVERAMGTEYIVDALKQCIEQACRKALCAVGATAIS